MIKYQCQVHGPLSGDNAQKISTLLRDAFGVDAFAAQAPVGTMTSLYADDPSQVPYFNEAVQYEDRWIVDVTLQADISVLFIPQQYADAASIQLIDVDVVYPPT